MSYTFLAKWRKCLWYHLLCSALRLPLLGIALYASAFSEWHTSGLQKQGKLMYKARTENLRQSNFTNKVLK